MFTLLYTKGVDYYTLGFTSQTSPSLSEADTSYAASSKRNVTLSHYCKQLLLMVDRRFARDPAWILLIMNIIIKHNILSENRYVVLSNRTHLTSENKLDRAAQQNTSPVHSCRNFWNFRGHGSKKSHALLD